MFLEILFGRTRNPSKIFPNIFINIGDMGAEIIWRPLTARRRFMTKIFPHPLVYTLTLHLIHPCTITLRYVDTQTHKSTKCGCKALTWALICTTCKIWTYTVDVCVQTYDMQNVNGHISTKWGRGDTLQPCWEERRTAAGFTTPHISKGHSWNLFIVMFLQQIIFPKHQLHWRCCGPTFSAKILLMKFKREILHG